MPDQYAAAPQSETGPEVAWWEGYHDPVLSELIRRAAIENRDVKMAAERLRAARAGAAVSRSWLMPSISGVAGYNQQGTGYDWPITERVPDTKAGGGGLDVSWEIDLAGGLRAGAKAAEADALAAEHGVRGVRLLVLSDVATNYFMLVGALRQLETVRAISAAQDETLRLVEARQRVGLATPFDVERAQTAAASARAAIPPLETLAAVSRHRIAVLIGDQAANAASITPWQGELAVPETKPGQPAELLERRPDLLAAQGAARCRERTPSAGPRRVVPAPLRRRALRSGHDGPQRSLARRHALHERRRAAGHADLQRRAHARDQRHRRGRAARSRAALRGRDRARARGRREHAGRVRRRTQPRRDA